MSRLLHRIGATAARHPWRVIAAWVLALAIVSGLASAFGGALNDNYNMPGTGSQRATDLLRDRFPAMSGRNERVSTYTSGSGETDGRNGEPKRNLWTSMLESVASGKKLPEKNLLVLGRP